MRSDNIKKGIARTPHRGLLMATGLSRKNMNAPFIGIASSFSDLVPGHIGMRDWNARLKRNSFCRRSVFYFRSAGNLRRNCNGT